MPDHDYIYRRTHARLLRRFRGQPRAATLHAAAYVLYSTVVGFGSTVLSYNGMMHGLVYLSIMAWTLLVCLHIGVSYMGSAANGRRRERAVQEEVFDADEEYNLLPEEMVLLHSRLSHELSVMGRSFWRLLMAGAGFSAVWGGGFLLMALTTMLGYVAPGWYAAVMMGSLLATLGVGVVFLPFGTLFSPREESVEHLRAIYYGKAKHAPVALDELAGDYEDAVIGDDGEMTMWEEEALGKRKRG
jgi:hypothetical protein